MRCEGVDSMAERLRLIRPRIPEANRSEDDILINGCRAFVDGEKRRRPDDGARISKSTPDRD